MHNLILSGGGVKAILHLGALKALDENGLLKNIKNYLGSSAGAFLSLLLCIGYNYNDIIIIFLKIEIDKFYEISDIFNFLNNYGLMSLSPVARLLRLFLNAKFKKKHINFKELYDLTGKTLHITAINVSSTEEVLFNYKNTPDIDIVDACIASCSIPFIFLPVKINGEYYMDAFAVNNYPCKFFCDDLENSIGIEIGNKYYNKINNFQDYIMNVFTSLKNYNYYNNRTKFLPKLNVSVDCEFNTINLDIKKKDIENIYIKGYNDATICIKDYLNKEEIKKTSQNNTETEPKTELESEMETELESEMETKLEPEMETKLEPEMETELEDEK